MKIILSMFVPEFYMNNDGPFGCNTLFVKRIAPDRRVCILNDLRLGTVRAWDKYDDRSVATGGWVRVSYPEVFAEIRRIQRLQAFICLRAGRELG